MATINDKYSFLEQSFPTTTSENRNYNLNLNQSKKCPILLPVQSYFKPNKNKYCASDNYEEKEKFHSWNKSYKISTFTTLDEDKKRWKSENTLNTINKSTLSLHTAAYENSIEAAASDLFGNESIEGLKKEKFGSIKTFKQCFTVSLKSQNPYEFPRQQDGDQRNKPEVMQFSTSQQLLGSSRPSSSQQNGHNGEQFVRAQVPFGADTAYGRPLRIPQSSFTGTVNYPTELRAPQNQASDMVKTVLPGTLENGVAGVIDLMPRTKDNQKPQYERQPRLSQSSFTGTVNYPTTSRPGHHVPAPRPLNKINVPAFPTAWTHYHALPSAQRSSSEVLASSTQLRPPQNQTSVPKMPPHRSIAADNKELSNGQYSNSHMNHAASCNDEVVSNENQHISSSVVNSMSTSRPVRDQPSSESSGADSFSSDECKVFDPKKHNLPQYIVKAFIFDKEKLQWKVALKRPPTTADAEFFKFCSNAHFALDALPIIPRKELKIGQCYFVKYGGKYYRGIYLVPARDNVYGLFDFADYDEGVKPIPFDDVREFPKVDEIRVPFMITWVFTDVCKIKKLDLVYCLFSSKFEEICFRPIHYARLLKVQN